MTLLTKLIAEWREWSDAEGGRGHYAVEETISQCISELEECFVCGGDGAIDHDETPIPCPNCKGFHMGQTMAECDCPSRPECTTAEHCLAELRAELAQ